MLLIGGKPARGSELTPGSRHGSEPGALKVAGPSVGAAVAADGRHLPIESPYWSHARTTDLVTEACFSSGQRRLHGLRTSQTMEIK